MELSAASCKTGRYKKSFFYEKSCIVILRFYNAVFIQFMHMGLSYGSFYVSTVETERSKTICETCYLAF